MPYANNYAVAPNGFLLCVCCCFYFYLFFISVFLFISSTHNHTSLSVVLSVQACLIIMSLDEERSFSSVRILWVRYNVLPLFVFVGNISLKWSRSRVNNVCDFNKCTKCFWTIFRNETWQNNCKRGKKLRRNGRMMGGERKTNRMQYDCFSFC